MEFIPRRIGPSVLESLKTFPCVYLQGPRQSGKSTLARHLMLQTGARYWSMDDLSFREAATHDPQAFLQQIEGPVIIDEIQEAPALFRPLKQRIDALRFEKGHAAVAGFFFLTGSAHHLALPALSDALVGRMVLHTLLPFSGCELSGHRSWLENVFRHEGLTEHSGEWRLEDLARASFPDLRALEHADRMRWCDGYVRTLMERDVHQLLDIEKTKNLLQLLRLMAVRHGGLRNEATLSREVGLSLPTLKRYLGLLEALFLTLTVPAWHANLGKRLIKSPKIYLADLNLLLYFLGYSLHDLEVRRPLFMGSLIENIVAIELTKQMHYMGSEICLYHYRTANGEEIDFILERGGAEPRRVAIEVKARKHVTAADFKAIHKLQEELGESFHAGYVVYLGQAVIPFGPKLKAVPLSVLAF